MVCPAGVFPQAFATPVALDKHTSRATARVIHAALVRFDHPDKQLDHALGGVELATALAFVCGEAAEEILVHPAENILRAGFVVSRSNLADDIDEFTQAGFIQGRA